MDTELIIVLLFIFLQIGLISPRLSDEVFENEELLFDPYDGARKRKVPLKAYVPRKKGEPFPVIFFSHGLGGSREASPYLGQYWAKAGYVTVFIQHPGSDDNIWKDVPFRERPDAFRQAINPEALFQRIQDVVFVIDQMGHWNQETHHPFSGRLDIQKIGMSGHSYGAVTAQALMGQTYLGGLSYPDNRLRAFLLLSPSARQRMTLEQAFGHIRRPVMCMTGTLDHSPMRGGARADSRRQVFSALPKGDKFQVVFEGARHFTFSGHDMMGRDVRDPRFHSAIQHLTTAFWDAYLKKNTEKRAYLQSDGPRDILVPKDVWEWK